MTESAPRVSVIVPTRNRLRLLRDAVRTLAAQEYPRDRLEIIVVNDGSIDGTRPWLERQRTIDPRIRPVHQPPLGIPAACNAGIRAAGGEFIAIVCDDFLMASDYVAHFVGFFRQRPEARVVRFGIEPADRWPGSRLSHLYYDVSFRKRLQPPAPGDAARSGTRRGAVRHAPLCAGITADHQLEASGAAAFRRGVFEEIGGFDEDLMRAEDTEMAVRLRAKGIRIYFDPRHRVVHRYGRWGVDTFLKNYESGIYAARLHRKLALLGRDAGNGGPGRVRRFLCLVGRVRQACGPAAGMLMLPGILLLESAWQGGYLREKLRPRSEDGARRPGRGNGTAA